MMTKEQLRGEIGAKRKGLDPDWIAAASQRVIENLVSMESFKTAGSVALYKAIGGEVQLHSLFLLCWELGKQTCIPVFDQTRKIYEMALITAASTFKSGHYGIQEPASIQPVSLKAIDLMIVPGVAFDLKGNRLGRGGGYYDRLLNGYSGVSAAVAFDFQLVEEIPVDPTDIPVHAVITESRTIKVSHNY